jgi:hypothetical protein
MKVTICKVSAQVYLIPYIKVTHDKFLNGRYEFIIGWWNREIIFSYA